MHCDDSLKLLKLYKRCYSSLLRLTWCLQPEKTFQN